MSLAAGGGDGGGLVCNNSSALPLSFIVYFKHVGVHELLDMFYSAVVEEALSPVSRSRLLDLRLKLCYYNRSKHYF